MEKKIRVAIFVGPTLVTPIYETMCLTFGKENVAASVNPKDLFGIVKTLRPTTLIIEPELFHLAGMTPVDINAYRTRVHYKILAVYPTKNAAKVRDHMKELNITKEYLEPTEFLTMAKELPRLSTNKYVKVKEPLLQFTAENIDRIFTECGFHCNTKGAPLLKEALFQMYFDQDLHNYGGGVKLYRELGEKYGYTPRVVERSILRFLENSWSGDTERKFRAELNIPDRVSCLPLNFNNFTLLFDTYYSLKYGMAEKLLAFPRDHSAYLF